MSEAEALTLQGIEELCEIWQGFVLMEKYGVPKDGCQSLEDMKERLRLHYYRQKGNVKSVRYAQEILSTLKKEDEIKRLKLQKLFEETLEGFLGLDEQILEHLRHEGILSEMAADVSTYMERLGSDECPILVTGETSSGKSSLMNLIVSKEILPTRLLSCTSVICKLQYNDVPHIKIPKEDGTVETKQLDLEADLVEQVKDHICKDNREELFSHKKVEIYLPLELLQTGITFLDSPGLGENSVMDKYLLDYISQNEILAFVYVIKSDNAGGVQEDRLQKLLRHIVKNQNRFFDPRSAIFVCNRWDLVPQTELDMVRTDTMKKLGKLWPELDPGQVFFMSTNKALTTQKLGYLADDYSVLLDGLDRLIAVALKRKVKVAYTWLDHLIGRVSYHLRAYLVKTRMSSDELLIRHKATMKRLRNIELEAESTLKYLEGYLDNKVEAIAGELCEYLESQIAREKMTEWSELELPLVAESETWDEIESQISPLIEQRLALLLREWDEQYKLFHRVQVDLSKTIRDELAIIEHEISIVEQCVQSDDLSLSEKSDEETLRFLRQGDENLRSSDFFALDLDLARMPKIALDFAAQAVVSAILNIQLGSPVFLQCDFQKWRRKIIATKCLQQYTEDPVDFMKHRSLEILGLLADLRNVTSYVNSQLDPARQYLESMRKVVPKLVEVNHSLIHSIIKDRRSNEELVKHYASFDTGVIPRLQEHLAEYRSIYLREFDFNKEVLDMTEAAGVGKGFVSKGIWAQVKAARLKEDGRCCVVSIKSYTASLSQMHLMNEEIHMRKVRHPHIAAFLGTFDIGDGTPAFVLEGPLVSARKELFGARFIPRKSLGKRVFLERSKMFLEQVGIGLEYMHSRGLVHMELSLDTILMTSNNDIAKLINLGEPRHAVLPPETDPAMNHVYLPPEVLRGQKYKSKSDMYSLGVTAWELWNQEYAFLRERNMPRIDFITEYGLAILQIDDACPFKTLIQKCLEEGPDERLSSTEWVDIIRGMVIADEVVEAEQAAAPEAEAEAES